MHEVGDACSHCAQMRRPGYLTCQEHRALERARSEVFEEVRADLRRAAWWARAWSLAYLWRERRINPNTRHMLEARARDEKTILRSTRVKITNLQSWRVHKHEKQAWARLEELSR